MQRRLLIGLVALVAFALHDKVLARDEPARPKVAVFPLSGTTDAALREKAGFSLRAKLDRDETYEPIDGPRMLELAAEVGKPIDLDTPVETLRKLSDEEDADVLIWGQLDAAPEGSRLRLNVLDVRQPDPRPRKIGKTIRQPTDLRFVVEEVIETLAGVPKHEHPSEQAVHADAAAERLWQVNPNLVTNGDFSQPGKWEGILGPQRYELQFADAPPAPDKAVLLRGTAGGASSPLLAMNLSKETAYTYGLAALSAPIPIQPNTRYRLSFRYRSDKPLLHVFVKGYTMAKSARGDVVEREVYRRQVPESAGTNGQWVTVVDELNPQHISMPVQHLRVDLYAYRFPGVVEFDDVVLKSVGAQTRQARDEAIDPPISPSTRRSATRP